MGDDLPKPKDGAESQTRRKACPRLINSAAAHRAVVKAVLKVGTEIRAKYPEQLSDRATAERLARLFRAVLIPRRQPGRRLSESVSIAAEMRLQGENWQNVYSAAIPGYRAMDKYERQWRCSNLRANTKKALKRRAAKAAESLVPVRNTVEI